MLYSSDFNSRIYLYAQQLDLLLGVTVLNSTLFPNGSVVCVSEIMLVFWILLGYHSNMTVTLQKQMGIGRPCPILAGYYKKEPSEQHDSTTLFHELLEGKKPNYSQF